MKLTPRLRALLVGAALLAAACGKQKTFVEVKIQPGASVPAGIKKLDVQLTLNGATVSTPLTEKDGADISFPTSASFEIRTGSGAMTIVVSAKDQAGKEIDLGTSAGSVVAGGVNLFEVHMQGGVASLVFDRPSADLGSAAVASTTAVSTLTLKNPGPVATGVVQLHFDEQGSPFSMSADTCSNKPLAGGASCTVGVAYTPLVGGGRTTTLRAVAAPGGTGEITLNATGLWVLTVTSATGSGGGSVALGGAAFCGSGCTSRTATFPNGASVALTAIPDSGSGFAGWGGDCQGTSTSCTLTFDRSHNVSASWVQQVGLTVSIAGSGAGTVSSDKPGISSCGSPTGSCGAVYDANTQVTLTATPASGSRVGVWTGCSSTTGSTCTVKLSSATSVGVSFIKTYNLTVATAGSGGGTVTPSSTGISSCGTNCYTYDAQTNVSLAAAPANGSRFAGWSGSGCSGTGTCPVTVAADLTIVATFNLAFLVSVTQPTGGGYITSTPSGINCTSTLAQCGAFFDSGSTVTLSATTDSTARFQGWGAGCTASGSTCTIASVAGPTSISANFIAIFPLSVWVTGSGTGSVTSDIGGISCPGSVCTATIDSGLSVTLTATPADTTIYATLGGDCSAVSGPTGSPISCKVQMSKARSVTVAFTKTVTLTLQRTGSTNASVVALDPTGSKLAGLDSSTTATSTTFTADVGAQVTFQARPVNGSNLLFARWGGVACAGSGVHDCKGYIVSQSGTINAIFTAQTYNTVFVSSQTFAANLGGARAYDAPCNQLATAAGINNAAGTAFVAWMSDGASNAGAQLVKAVSTARGWTRLDGAPFSDLPSDFEQSNKVYNPISVDETGATATGSAWTGTNGQGTTSGQNCTNWTNNAPPPPTPGTGPGYTAGEVLGGPQSWTAAIGGGYCNTPQRIYCFENDRSTALAVTATTGKLMFISPETFSLTAGGGTSSADAFCKQSAPTGNTSSWRALLSTTTTPASSVLLQAQTYVSKDGIVIGTGAQIAAGTPLTGIWQRADGTYATNFPRVWTGANLPSQLGTSTTTCGDWSDPTAANGFVGEADDTNWFFKFFTGGDACSKKTNAVYCVEQ